VKSILVLRTAALGDVVMSMPALGKLREAFPARRIVLLTIQTTEKKTQLMVASYAGSSSSVPWVNLVMPHLVDDVVVMGSLSSWKDVKLMRERVSGFTFEAGVLMVEPCTPWLSRLKKLLLLGWVLPGMPLYGWRGRGSLNGDRTGLKQVGLLRHHVHGPLQFLSELSPPLRYTDAELKFDLRPSADAQAWAKDWLEQRNLLGRRLVAIAPGALQAHKQWPIGSFQALLRRLLSQHLDVAVLVVGTLKDRPLGEVLCADAPERVFNVAGVSSIEESAALFGHVLLLVGNDGGAMHLGDAMGCKVVSIVPGIEYPDSIEPWHNKDLAVRWLVDCAPCYSFTHCPQGHRRCMLDLPVDLVWTQCQRVLQSKSYLNFPQNSASKFQS
jgi:heptosyltransferase-2